MISKLRKWWRSMLEADPMSDTLGRSIDTRHETDALLQSLAPAPVRIEPDVEDIAEHLDELRAKINRRLLLRQAAAFVVAVGAAAREGLRDVSIPGDFYPGEIDEWSRSGADPLRDIMEARRKIWESVGLVPSVVILGAGQRSYMRARFGLDVADPKVREELGRELGLRVELAEAT